MARYTFRLPDIGEGIAEGEPSPAAPPEPPPVAPTMAAG